TTYSASGKTFVTGVGGSSAGVTETRNAYYIYDNDAGLVRMSIASTGAATFSSSVTATIFDSTSNAYRLNGNNALSLVSLGGQSVVKINAAGYWGTQLVGANDQGILVNNVGRVSIGTDQSLARLNAKNSSIGSITRGLALYNNGSDGVGTGISLDFYVNAGDDDRCARIISTQSTSGLYADLQFHTSNNALPVERMRITSGGDIAIGDTSSSARLWARRTDDGNTFGVRATNASYSATVGFFGADRNTTNNSFYYIDCYNYGSSSYRFRVADSGNIESAGSIKTGAPSGGTAQPWKLGTVYTGTCVPSDFGSFGSWFTGTVIEIEVNGTTYKIPAVIDNYC
ncbi:MAG: hypothetical protein WBH12_03710, partial [Sediminibacterium sp.]